MSNLMLIIVAQIDTDFSFGSGTLDAKNQIYYWVTLQKVNNTFSNAFLHSVSILVSIWAFVLMFVKGFVVES